MKHTILIQDKDFLTRHPDFVGKSVTVFAMLGKKRLRVNNSVVEFTTSWNCCRHFLGMMNICDPGLKMSDRLN
jgi:hypothetical protein